MNSDFQIKLFKLMERVWLVGVLIGIAGVVYFLIQKDNDSALYFFGFFILSSVLYLLRKRQRKRHESYLENGKK
ncbi:MAG: hypothetical protein ACK5QC_08780 [Bacteroidota bacterium]|jgi:hypothetical protein|nr:hypothetical protein [Bacteroidota bacterium]MCA6443063.1 hypothetical protein [Bacteroidota bacterium]